MAVDVLWNFSHETYRVFLCPDVGNTLDLYYSPACNLYNRHNNIPLSPQPYFYKTCFAKMFCELSFGVNDMLQNILSLCTSGSSRAAGCVGRLQVIPGMQPPGSQSTSLVYLSGPPRVRFLTHATPSSAATQPAHCRHVCCQHRC